MEDLVSGTTKDGKVAYLAMELFPMSLSAYVDASRGRLPEHVCYSIAAAAMRILQFLHTHSVIFNDIKVDNFMLRETPQGYQLVIVDFGAAEVYGMFLLSDS